MPTTAASAVKFRPLTSSGFSARAALACEIGHFRASSGWLSPWSEGVNGLVWEAARIAALEDGGIQSPLVDLAEAGCRGVRRLYEMAYWFHSPAFDPERYFDVDVDGRFVELTSRGVAHGEGRVRLHESHLDSFFRRLRSPVLDSYYFWATNPNPVRGRAVLFRHERIARDDDPFDDDGIDRCDAFHHEDRTAQHHPRAGKITIDPDTHPSEGKLVRGDPDQELVQLAALLRLEPSVQLLLSFSAAGVEERQAAAERARQIGPRVKFSFMPTDGYCSWCGSDVTLALINCGPDDGITGCPVCGRSWCD